MRIPTNALRFRLTAVALGVVLCGGCTANGSETPGPPTSSAAASEEPVPTPSPTEVPVYDGTAPPQMPADMASDSHLGARAAATYFVDVRHWAFVSNDPTALVEICDSASAFCSSSIQAVRENATLNAQILGGRPALAIRSVLPPADDTPFFEVLGTISEEPMTKSVDDEMVFTTDGQEDVPFVIFVEHVPSTGWIIRGADVDTR